MGCVKKGWCCVGFIDKKYGPAVEEYGRAIDLDPENAIYYSNRALAHIRMENYGAALEDAAKATELDPSYVKVGIWGWMSLELRGDSCGCVEAIATNANDKCCLFDCKVVSKGYFWRQCTVWNGMGFVVVCGKRYCLHWLMGMVCVGGMWMNEYNESYKMRNHEWKDCA